MNFGKKSTIDYINPDEIKEKLPDIKKKLSKYFLLFLLIIVGSTVLSQGWFTVSEQESAVVKTCGKVTDVKGAGLHFKIPLFQSVTKVNMTTRGMELGYSSTDPNSEYVQINQLSNQQYDTRENLMITNDFNIVSIDFYAEWRVTQPEKFLYASEAPEVLLTNIIQSSARDIVSAYSVDSALTDGKSEIQTKIRELVGRVLDSYDVGMMVTNIIIQDAEPPTADVIAAFKAVEDAKQKKDTLLNEANRYYNENIPGARAEADRITKSSEAVKEARVNEATGQAARFNEMFSQYILNPEITKSRMYLEAMEEILPSLKVYIDSADNGGMLKILDVGREG